jgi:hypothetical protein
MASRYYSSHLEQLFDDIFTSAYFYWSNLRFIIVYIANFKFVWKDLKFNQGFVKSFLRAIQLNPHFLKLAADKIHLFDEFLALHEIRHNPKFLGNLSKVSNLEEVVDKILTMKIRNVEQIGCYKVKRTPGVLFNRRIDEIENINNIQIDELDFAQHTNIVEETRDSSQTP